MTCTTPNCDHEIDGTGWPGKDGGTLCQECWEDDCSESWWSECAAMQEFCEPTPYGTTSEGELAELIKAT